MKKVVAISLMMVALLLLGVKPGTIITGDDIQAAIDALPPEGGEVSLSSGTYEIAESILLRSNVKVSGAGSTTILKATGDVSIFIAQTKENIEISNMTLEGNDNAQYVAVHFKWGGQNIRISSVTVRNWQRMGLFFEDSNNVTIENSWFFNIGSVGGDAAVWFSRGEDNKILGNTLQDNQNAISAQGMSNSVVANNTIKDSALDGINLTAGTNGNAYGNVISNNVIQSSGALGIILNGCDESVVVGNRVFGSGQHGIDLDGSSYNTVSGNTVTNSGWSGIRTYFNPGRQQGSSDNIISGNIVLGSSQESADVSGIDMGRDCNYNHIFGNTVRKGEAQFHRYGIRIELQSEGNIVRDNDLYDGYLLQPILDQGTGTIIRDNRE